MTDVHCDAVGRPPLGSCTYVCVGRGLHVTCSGKRCQCTEHIDSVVVYIYFVRKM